MSTVPWRRVVVALSIVVAVLTAGIFALRSDGFRAVDATVPRATRRFVSDAAGLVVLADGFSGRILAQVEVDNDGAPLEVAQSASGVAVLDRSAATSRSIDAATLRVGPPQSLSLVAAPEAVVGVGQAGVVAVDPTSEQAVVLPPGGDQVVFDTGPAGTGTDTRIAPDGAIWTLADGTLSRITTTTREVVASNIAGGRFTLVGNSALVLDVGRRRVMFRDGDWVSLPDEMPTSEVVLQQPGPNADCGWIGGDDTLWCVGDHGPDQEVTIDALDIDGADLLSIAGEAGALVRRQTSTIVRLDWRAGKMLDGPNDPTPTVPAGASLSVTAAVDLVWIDDVDGPAAWAVNPWGINTIDKNEDALLLGESGEVLSDGEGGTTPSISGGGDTVTGVERQPDNDGIDDPPVAVPDSVTARTGIGVPIAVTANDYDTDGEAIALVTVGTAAHGTVDIANATTALYLPTNGYVGLDEFTYTIVDGNGTEASAKVTIELLSIDAANQPPVGTRANTAETATDVPVVIDVLLNDVDPERDALRVGSFTPPNIGGDLRETTAPSGLPGLRYEPTPGTTGTATFTYRPVDSFGAVGEAVQVKVEIGNDENRPPIVLPDAVRVRRDIPLSVPVLANDRDPDGDRMQVRIKPPLPPGIDVSIDGDELVVVARAGAAALTPFGYEVDDGNGHTVPGSVLVVLIGDLEPNRPPIANADSQSVVAGKTTQIDVRANDTDPDGDPVILLSVARDNDSTSSVAGSIRVSGNQVEYAAPDLQGDDDVLDRFTYTITDGNGHQATGQVNVRVLPDEIVAPPFARDDSATTTVDKSISIDVLANDGDPSGERPTIVGSPGCAGGGTATVTAEQRVTFTPPPRQTGVFTCSYEITNSQGLRTGATIVVSVLAAATNNVPPVVVDEQVVIDVNTSTTVDVLANDSDPDGGATPVLRVLSSSTPTLGTAVRDGRSITFDAGPVTGFSTITYQVGDAGGGVTTGRLTFQIVEPAPIAPVAFDDLRTITGPGSPTPIDVITNDSDPDGLNSDLRVTSVSLQSGDGTVSAGPRVVTFQPNPSFVGTMVANYVVTDLDGLTDTGQVSLVVTVAPNRPPVALDDAGEVVNGGSVTIPIALNDQDPDGDALAYSITSPPNSTLGTARIQNASLVFNAVPGAAGVALVQYQVDDGKATASATVQVSVLPCADAPPDVPDVFLQTGYQQPIFVDLTTYARNGAVVDVGGPIGAPSGIYTPPAGENGNIVYTYAVRNSCRIQDVGQVTIDVNQDPIGAPYEARIGRTTPFSIPVSALASDTEPLTIGALLGAPSWVVIADEGRSVLIDPKGSFGRVDVTVVIVDPGGLQVQVPLGIELINLPPVANPDQRRIDAGTLTFDPLANDSDPDGDTIALQSVPASVMFPNGVEASIVRLPNDRLQINPGGGIGTATFTYTVVDAVGLPSEPATVTIVVNSPPSAPQVDVTLPAGGTVDVMVPASDPDADPLVLTLGTDPSPLTIVIDGLTLHVTAPTDSADTDYTIPYTVTDPAGATGNGFLMIHVAQPPTTTTTTTTVPGSVPGPPVG